MFEFLLDRSQKSSRFDCLCLVCCRCCPLVMFLCLFSRLLLLHLYSVYSLKVCLRSLFAFFRFGLFLRRSSMLSCVVTRQKYHGETRMASFLCITPQTAVTSMPLNYCFGVELT